MLSAGHFSFQFNIKSLNHTYSIFYLKKKSLSIIPISIFSLDLNSSLMVQVPYVWNLHGSIVIHNSCHGL